MLCIYSSREQKHFSIIVDSLNSSEHKVIQDSGKFHMPKQRKVSEFMNKNQISNE